MSVLAPPELSRQRMASVLLAMAFFVMEAVWALVLAFLLVLALRWGLADPAWMALGALGALAVNTWALARTLKNGHFLWLYARWPSGDPGGARPEDERLKQARLAFVDGDMERVVLLARKPLPGPRPAELDAGLGRALALQGRLQEAAEAFAAHGSEAEALRWLRPRRAWGLDWPIHFRPADALWARRHLRLVVLAAASLLGALWSVEASVALSRSQRSEGFDRQGFKVSQRGAFTFYYHDPAFRDLVADLAEAALEHQLAFLERTQASFAPGELRLYLCETREEYLARAPYAPPWEQASALPAQNSIYIHKLPPDQPIYFASVLAHELSHLLYHRFFPVRGNDAWLNEGLADYLGYAFALERAGFPRQEWLRRNRFQGLAGRSMPFDRFFSTDPHALADVEDVKTFYRQGFSVVFMLVEHYGRKDFLRFLDAYRRRGDAALALADAYPSIQGLEDLAAVWGLFFGNSS